MSSAPAPATMSRGELEQEVTELRDTVQRNNALIEDLMDRVQTLEEEHDETATVSWEGGNPADLEIEPSDHGPSISPMESVGAKMDEDLAFDHLDDLRSEVEAIKHDQVDREDLVAGAGMSPELPVEELVAKSLDDSRKHDLTANQYRAAHVFRAFGGHCESWSGILKITSSDVRNIFAENEALQEDPNPNTVQRTMKMLAKHTRDVAKYDRSPTHEENLLRVRNGEQRLELVAEKDEWHDYWDGIEERTQQLLDGGDP